ncbi:Uncharacterised protein [Klebsiella pneumoniae]|nr:Uncharacterised protein [Klebsiella pneumoniae]
MHTHRNINTINFPLTGFLNKLIYIPSIRYVVVFDTIQFYIIINTFNNET